MAKTSMIERQKKRQRMVAPAFLQGYAPGNRN